MPCGAIVEANSLGLPAGGTKAGVANLTAADVLLVTSTPLVALSLPTSMLLKRATSGLVVGVVLGGAGVAGAGAGAGAGVPGGRVSGGGGGEAAVAPAM